MTSSFYARDTNMVACDQGYLCDVCGKDVEAITDSDLYLRYIMGEVPPLALANMRERHIRCNPATAQYIVDPAFVPLKCEGIFAKELLDAVYVAQQETLVTRAWRRLQEVPRLGIPLTEYPLPEVVERWSKQELNHRDTETQRKPGERKN
jgi:hypothetical protein